MLKIRLRRMGKTHSPFYRVVVSDSRRTPTASAVEEVGHYNPRLSPPDVKLDLERLRYWQDQGALLSPTVKNLVHRLETGKLEAEAAKPTKAEKKAAKKAEEEKKAAAAKAEEEKKAAEAKAEEEKKAAEKAKAEEAKADDKGDDKKADDAKADEAKADDAKAEAAADDSADTKADDAKAQAKADDSADDEKKD